MPPRSRANIDPNFEKRLREGKTHAKAEHDNRRKGRPVPWERPEEFAADLTDLAAIKTPFSRAAANQDAISAMQDSRNPGTSGDVVAATTQIDVLACMERAYRQRFMSRPRAVALAMGRKRGHGDDKGPFVQCGIEYVRTLLRLAKRPSA